MDYTCLHRSNPAPSGVREQVAVPSSMPEASHALDHDLVKTLNLVTQNYQQSMGGSCLSRQDHRIGANEPDFSPSAAARQKEGSRTHPAAAGRPVAAATRVTESSRAGPPARRRRESGRRGAGAAPSSQLAGLSRAAMVRRAQGRMHAPAEDLEEHVTTPSPWWDGPRAESAQGRGGWSLTKMYTRVRPSYREHLDPAFILRNIIFVLFT